MDALLANASESELTWFPGSGYGFLPLSCGECKYDDRYWQNYVNRANTEMGRCITDFRRDLVDSHTRGEVIDIGIGCGAFVEAREKYATTYGYDVNHRGVSWLIGRGSYCNPYKHNSVDSLTFWDSIEHIENPSDLLRRARQYVFITVPVYRGDIRNITDWKHYKPGEHCWYFAEGGITAFMGRAGFEAVEVRRDEQDMGREDVASYVFRRA